MDGKLHSVVLPRRSHATLPRNDNSLSRHSGAQAVRMSSHPSDHDYLTELAPILNRRFADLLLFGVTSAALILLLLQVPTFRIVDWIYMLQHSIVLGIALTRPEPLAQDCSLRSNLAVGVAYLYPYAQVICLSWWPGTVTWPEAGLVLVTFAAVFSVICLLTVGRSFGIRPALRALITSGPYRLVRHPLYLSYLIADIGYNLQQSSLNSLMLVIVAWACMVYRVLAEEQVLSGDSKWPTYVRLVTYRLVPGLW